VAALHRGFRCSGSEPERIEKTLGEHRFWKRELGLLGFDIGGKTTPASETPITPIIIGDGKLTMDVSRELFKEGVLGTGSLFPQCQQASPHTDDLDGTHTEDRQQP
jgi:glycine C-acetyltransferase